MHTDHRTHLTTRRSVRRALRFALFASGLAQLVTTGAQAQELPGPLAFVSQLDLECRKVTAAPPPAAQLGIRQLNPVLEGELPDQVAQLGQLEELCVPVQKNGQTPGPKVLPIARWVDLACYEATAPEVDVEVNLTHLNPVLANLPDEDVKLVKLAQVCVPVRKNQAPMPPVVEAIVRHVDIACYQLEEETKSADQLLTLSHLNPVIRAMGFQDRVVRMRRARQLCVPVGKNAQPIPPAVKSLVRWVDFLKYRVEPVAGVIPGFNLGLRHLNPLFAEQPAFQVHVSPAQLRLMVPVAKDGVLPPPD